jgi:hypothetical protein
MKPSNLAAVKLGLLILILTGWLFLSAMGSFDQLSKPEDIPLPEKEVTALLTDSEGLTLALTQFSLNGQTYLAGRLGAGRVAIPFNQIRQITLSPEPRHLAARIHLADTTQLNLQLEKDLKAYGRLKVGTYQVPLEKVKKIEIQGVAERKKQ